MAVPVSTLVPAGVLGPQPTVEGATSLTRAHVGGGDGAAPRSVNYVQPSAASAAGAASGCAAGEGGSTAAASSSSAAATTPPLPRREQLPARQRLLELSAEVEIELTSLAASREVAASARVRALTSKTRSICFNLSDAKNPELRSRLLDGELSAGALVRLNTQQMASGSLRAQRDEWKANRLKCAIRPERHLGFQTNLYKCEGCGSRSTRVHRTVRAGQQQVDRARTYVTCTECSRRWEEGGM